MRLSAVLLLALFAITAIASFHGARAAREGFAGRDLLASSKCTKPRSSTQIKKVKTSPKEFGVTMDRTKFSSEVKRVQAWCCEKLRNNRGKGYVKYSIVFSRTARVGVCKLWKSDAKLTKCGSKNPCTEGGSTNGNLYWTAKHPERY